MSPERLSPSLESYLTRGQETLMPHQGHVNEKMSAVLEKTLSHFHNTLQETIESTQRKNNIEINKLKREIRSQKQRANDYLTVYNYLRGSLSRLIEIKNKSPNKTTKQAIQLSEDHSLFIDFFNNLFTLLACRDVISESRSFQSQTVRVCVTPNTRPNAHEIKESYNDEKAGKCKRIIIDSNNTSIDCPEADLDTCTPSISAVPAKSDRQISQIIYFDMRPHRKRFTPKPWGFYLAKVIQLPKKGLNQARRPTPQIVARSTPTSGPVYKNPLTKFNLVSSDQNTFAVKPIANCSDYIVDHWYLTQLAAYTTQLVFAAFLTDGSYQPSDFLFFKDKTVFQGRMAYTSPETRAANQGVCNQGRHMNFIPQSYDLITYYVLKKIKETKTISPFEASFLQSRKLLDDVNGLRVLYKEFVNLIFVRQKTPFTKLFQEYFVGFTRLNPEKFIRITSVVARTHLEATANATYDAPSLSNGSDHAIESVMHTQIEKIQKLLLGIVEPEIPYAIQETPRLLPRKAFDPSTPRWKQPKKEFIEAEKDAFIEIRQAITLFDPFYRMLQSYCIDFMTKEEPSNYYLRKKLIQGMNIEEFSALFLHLIDPENYAYTFVDQTYPDKPTESIRSRPFSKVEHLQLRKLLEEWIEKNCTAAGVRAAEQLDLPTPKINALERHLKEKRFYKLEYALLFSKNQAITEKMLERLNTSFQKSFDFSEMITPYPSKKLSRVYEDSETNFSARLQDLASTFLIKLKGDPKLSSKYPSPVAVPPTAVQTSATNKKVRKPVAQLDLNSPSTLCTPIQTLASPPSNSQSLPLRETSTEIKANCPDADDELPDLFG